MTQPENTFDARLAALLNSTEEIVNNVGVLGSHHEYSFGSGASSISYRVINTSERRDDDDVGAAPAAAPGPLTVITGVEECCWRVAYAKETQDFQLLLAANWG